MHGLEHIDHAEENLLRKQVAQTDGLAISERQVLDNIRAISQLVRLLFLLFFQKSVLF
jgi:hypothetical protein